MVKTAVQSAISYDRLWKLLLDRKMRKKDLENAAHISSAVIAKMGRSQSVNLETLVKICRVLQCDLENVVEVVHPSTFEGGDTVMPSFTRKAIMSAFLQLLEERPLNKITVKDIVDACGINRNTFYYHFADIPALIEAIFKEEADLLMREHTQVGSLQELLMIAVDFILKNRRAALHLYNSNNRDIYERDLMKICQYAVETYLNSLVDVSKVNPTDWAILTRSYRCWCFGLLIDWLDDGLKEDIKPELKRLCELREGTVESAITNCRKLES